MNYELINELVNKTTFYFISPSGNYLIFRAPVQTGTNRCRVRDRKKLNCGHYIIGKLDGRRFDINAIIFLFALQNYIIISVVLVTFISMQLVAHLHTNVIHNPLSSFPQRLLLHPIY